MAELVKHLLLVPRVGVSSLGVIKNLEQDFLNGSKMYWLQI
jgi:hypothetical protein